MGVGLRFETVKNRLPQVRGRSRQKLGAALRRIAEDAAEEARRSIEEGPKTGHIYTSGPPPLPHQASAPGEPPADWTGELGRSVDTMKLGPFEWAVIATADYAAELEYGSADGTVAPRPFLGPAVAKQEGPFEGAMGRALRESAEEASR